MKRRSTLYINQKHMYALTSDESGQLYLEVVCGGFAMYEVTLPLSPDEEASYRAQGESFLDDLAWRVLKDREAFSDRLI